MPVIFGVDAGDTRTVERVRVNNPRAATLAVAADVRRLVYAFDMAQLTDPAVTLRMLVEVSADGGVEWRDLSACEFSGGSVSRSGDSPRGDVAIPARATHLRTTLIPLAGNATVGVWVKVI